MASQLPKTPSTANHHVYFYPNHPLKPTFDALYNHFFTLPAAPLLPPPHSHYPALTGTISSPPSTQPSKPPSTRSTPTSPAPILSCTTCNGARPTKATWYKNVAENEIFQHVWRAGSGALERSLAFIGRVEKLRKKNEGEKGQLEEGSLKEIKGVVEWCVEKSGNGEVVDANRG
ncbi:hypothetical protein MMC08_006074 [Hypocenomyce scalaris]|nr:hypothetical protein [Hypocenomyce scalaris]